MKFLDWGTMKMTVCKMKDNFVNYFGIVNWIRFDLDKTEVTFTQQWASKMMITTDCNTVLHNLQCS